MSAAKRAPLLRVLASSFKGSRLELQRRLEKHGLHAGQDYLLEQLWAEDGLTVGLMAERLGIEVPTVVRTVDRLEAAGVVRREPDPADRRRARILLTDRGRELEPIVRGALDDVTRVATSGLTAAERRELVDLLGRVHDNLRTDR